jgi:RNA polymerase sigma-70 factor (ECF subfamily)
MTPDSTPSATETRFESAWREHSGYLVALASRILEDTPEAEDVVQEAFDRLSRVSMDEIVDVRGWLAVVVRRLCLDRLRSAYTRRESKVGSSVPESTDVLGAPPSLDPADRVTLDDRIRLALAIMLDRLSPAERSAFVLHDVFGFPFEAIAEIVGRTSGACRQLASRARHAIRSDAAVPPPEIEVTEHQLVVERFIAACAGGDLGALMAVLDPNVTGDAMLIGIGPHVHVEGALDVATRVLRVMGPPIDMHLEPLFIDDDIALVAVGGDGTRGVIRFQISDARIVLMHAFVLEPGAS